MAELHTSNKRRRNVQSMLFLCEYVVYRTRKTVTGKGIPNQAPIVSLVVPPMTATIDFFFWLALDGECGDAMWLAANPRIRPHLFALYSIKPSFYRSKSPRIGGAMAMMCSS